MIVICLQSTACTIFTESMQPFDSHVLFWGKLINSFLNNPINRCNWTNKYLGHLIIDIMILTTAIRSLACFSCEICRKYLARSKINIHNFQCFRLLFDKRIAHKNSLDQVVYFIIIDIIIKLINILKIAFSFLTSRFLRSK